MPRDLRQEVLAAISRARVQDEQDQRLFDAVAAELAADMRSVYGASWVWTEMYNARCKRIVADIKRARENRRGRE